MNEDPQILATADGSQTLFNPVLNETYHSRHGALQESKHVFIEAGFLSVAQKTKGEACLAPTIRIFEMGFGTGLNAFLTFLAAREFSVNVFYETIETHPLPENIFKNLDYGKILGEENLFSHLHECEWEKPVSIEKNFTILKRKIALRDFITGGDLQFINADAQFINTGARRAPLRDLIYFDAFSPDKQPELWTEEVFQGLAKICAPDAVLVTYCAKGNVKRALKAAGWKVEALPGAAKKREMIRAFKVLQVQV